MTFIERPMDEICQPVRPGSVMFPERKNFYDHVDLCYQMRGQPTTLESKEEHDRLTEVYKQYPTCRSITIVNWFFCYIPHSD